MTDQRVLEDGAQFQPQRALWIMAASSGCAVAIAIAAVVAAALSGDWVGLAFFGVLAVIFAASAWPALRLATLGARLTRDCVLTPRLLRGYDAVPLDEITDIALLYQPMSRAAQWQLRVWRGPEKSRVIYARQPSPPEPPGRSNASGLRRHTRKSAGYVPVLDWDYLAGTDIGKQAQTIYRAVLARQGRDSLNSDPHAGHNPPQSATGATAYWTPDRRIGAFSGRT